MNPEQILAAAVVAHYAPAEVFQEVKSRTGATADIVVKVGQIGWIIECKVALGLAVLWQAIRWKEHGAALVSVAVYTPKNPHRNEIAAADRCLRLFGIGLIYVDADRGYVREVRPPKLLRRRFVPEKYGKPRRWEILNECREEHKTFCPAGSQSGQWSAFKATLQAVRDLLEARGPLTMKEILANVETHYANHASARRCLSEWLQCPKVTPWAVVIRDGPRLFFAAKPNVPEDANDRKALAEGAAAVVSDHYKKAKARADERKANRSKRSET